MSGVLHYALFHAGIPIFIGWLAGNSVRPGSMTPMSQRTAYMVTTVAGALSLIAGVVGGNPAYAMLDAGAALVGWVIGMVLAIKRS